MPDVETKGISTSSQNVVEVNSAAIKTAVEIIDNAISGNEMQVDIVSGGGGTQYADGAVRGTATGNLLMVDDGINIQSASGDATGKLNINISNSPAVTVTSGAITETNSNSIKTAVESINTKLVSGTDIGDVTINNANGVNAVNIQDGGNTITVDGAVTATVTATDLDIRNLTSTDVVTVTGGVGQTADVKVTLDSESVTVTGSITANAGTNLNTSTLALETGGNLATISGDTTSIDGKITACNTGAVVVSSGAITETNSNSIKTAVELLDNAISGNEMQVDVVAPLPTGTNTIGNVTGVATTLVSGRKTIATAGTAEVLKASTTLTQGVIIMALKTNTNNIFVGDSNVDKTTDKQYELEPGEAIAIGVNNTNLIYVDVTTNGEGVQFIGS